MNSPAPLPTDLAETHALILQQREELAAAEARASGAAATIAHLKLVIAKLRRDQHGQSAERGRKLLDQLELQLEELEADATERSVIAERDTSVQAFARRRPVRAPLPAHLPRERVITPVEGDPDRAREVQLPVLREDHAAAGAIPGRQGSAGEDRAGVRTGSGGFAALWP